MLCARARERICRQCHNCADIATMPCCVMLCCHVLRIDPADTQSITHDADWGWQDVPSPEGEVSRGRMPAWVAEYFREHNKPDAALAAAAAAAQQAAAAAAEAGAAAADASAPGMAAVATVNSPAGQQPAAAASHAAAHLGPAAATTGVHVAPGAAAASPVAALQPALTPWGSGAMPEGVAGGAASPTPSPNPAGHNMAAATGNAAPAGPAAAAAVSPRSAAADGDLLNLLPAISSGSHDSNISTAGGPGDSHCTASSGGGRAVSGGNSDPWGSIQAGFLGWLETLYPTQEEGDLMKSTLNAVGDVLRAKARGQAWSVAAVHPVGSYAKKTSLRGS